MMGTEAGLLSRVRQAAQFPKRRAEAITCRGHEEPLCGDRAPSSAGVVSAHATNEGRWAASR